MTTTDPIETARLVLRPWRLDDLDELVPVFAKPEVWWFPFRRGWSPEETERFVRRKLDDWANRGWSHWVVETRSGGDLIGSLGLSPLVLLPEAIPTVEIGWRLDPDHWSRGYATEGGRAALQFGFAVLGLDEVVGLCEPANVASGRLMERLGMAHDHDTTHPTFGVSQCVFKLCREQREASS